jgi:hypothetical protein
MILPAENSDYLPTTPNDLGENDKNQYLIPAELATFDEHVTGAYVQILFHHHHCGALAVQPIERSTPILGGSRLGTG